MAIKYCYGRLEHVRRNDILWGVYVSRQVQRSR